MKSEKVMDDMVTAVYLMQIIQTLKYLRESTDIMQEQFYEQTGIHIGRIEAGKSNITLVTILRICEYYKITPKSFFELFEKLSLLTLP